MFTVVIPLYNKELSIKNTIQSVLNQTYQDFEIIVIDDGSIDGSAKIVKSISDDRIRLVSQSNQGVSAARNCGIRKARHEWIAFLDGDDLWEDNHLEEVKKMMRMFPDEKIFATSFRYSDERKMFRHSRKNSIFIIENYFKEASKENIICTDVITINKICFDHVGVFNESMTRGEDTDLWVRLARNYNIIKSSVITAIYRVEAENRTSLSKNLESTYVYHINLNKVIDFDEKKYFKEIITNRLYQYARSKDLNNFLKLKNRYPSISYNLFIKYSIKHILKSSLKRIPKINNL
ncbi:glycosyltransferase [Psychrobacter frigidicola]|uniref:Glycosyltransferase n=1 Tax=Psychrobacter frigidicola TaxID=45611 RepID=A0A5C7A4P5_9GAMM|nr:glycosyltransferase [Psychrobacter frigidicola]TXD98098.1 glycosyltransferase [Psychrobacter frigidicola]